MNFDFALLLVMLTFGTALLCLLDIYFFAPRRARINEMHEHQNKPATPKKRPLIVEYARSFFPILLLVLCLRSFLFEPFRIPSSSMMPTLLIGDFILVNKFMYGVRLPVLNTLIWKNSSPTRGDVIVFRYPLDTNISYIKRVVGLPGDHVVYHNHALYINGKLVQQEMSGPFPACGGALPMEGAEVYQEFLADTHHNILIRPSPGRDERRFEAWVPAGHYFVLGDNRNNSRDSRYWGFVPEQNLVGRASVIWMNWDWKNWANGFIAFSRIGDGII